MRTLRLLALVALALGSLAGIARAAEDEGFKPLFDGKTLEGWTGDTDLWSVEDGAIAGCTDNKALKHNSFLSTTKSYKNFILKAKFKLRNHNSGIQIRSKQRDDFVVTGYQPDIADTTHTGSLYEEGGRGVLGPMNQELLAKIYKNHEWTDYEIACDGPHIVLKLNGVQTVDYTEKDPVRGATEGIFALQLHAGPKMKVWFKDILIKELP